MLLFLSSLAKAALSDLAHRADSTVAGPNRNPAVETRRTRQAHYLKFCQGNNIPLAVAIGNGPQFGALLGMYAQSLAEGHTLQRKELRSQTIREYLEAINLLFTSHSFDAPVDFNDKKSISTNVYDSVKTWESEPNQRTYMAPEVLAALMTKAAAVAQNAPDSLIPVVCDWVLLSHYTGF